MMQPSSLPSIPQPPEISFGEAVATWRRQRAGAAKLAVEETPVKEAPALVGGDPKSDARLGRVLYDLANSNFHPASDQELAQKVLDLDKKLLQEGESMSAFVRRVRRIADSLNLFAGNGTRQAHTPTDIEAPTATMSIGEAWEVWHQVGPRDVEVLREYQKNTQIRLSTDSPLPNPSNSKKSLYGEIAETERRKKLAKPGTLEPAERTEAEQAEIVSLLNRASKVEARLRRVDPKWWARLDRDKRHLSRFKDDSRQRLPEGLLEAFASLVGGCELLVGATGITSRMT
jgi:hypothetical protein